MVCSKTRGRGGLYRFDGVLRSVTDDDGGQGAPADQRRGRGHGGVQGAQSIVMRVLAQEEVVKHSGVRAASVVTADGHRRPARRVRVEREPMGGSGGFLVRRGHYGQRQRLGRGHGDEGAAASVRASMSIMA